MLSSMNSLARVIRSALRKHPLSLPAIAQKTGVPVTTLYEFMAGADMRLANASKLARFLALELRPRRR